MCNSRLSTGGSWQHNAGWDVKLKRGAGWDAQTCQKKVDDGTRLTGLVLEAIRTLCGRGEELVWEANGDQGKAWPSRWEAKFQFASGLLLMNSGPPQSEVAHACDSSASRQSPFGTPISLGIIAEVCLDREQRLHFCAMCCAGFTADLPGPSPKSTPVLRPGHDTPQEGKLAR